MPRGVWEIRLEGDECHADRSRTGGLALYHCLGDIRVRGEFRGQPIVILASLGSRRDGGTFVQRNFCILDILPARLAAADVDRDAKIDGQRRRAGTRDCARKALKPSEGHYTSGQFAIDQFAPLFQRQ
jgi:hypothetical protein